MIRSLLCAAIAVAAILAISSCTDEQIARVQAIVTETDQKLAAATAAVSSAEAALVQAKAIADQIGSVQAKQIVAQAGVALDQVKQAQQIIATTDGAAHSALDAAKQAQAAGTSSVGVVVAAAGGAVPGIIAAIAAIAKWLPALRSFRQTVTGLAEARKELGEEIWGAKVAPALSSSQDEATKAHVAQVLAKAA